MAATAIRKGSKNSVLVSPSQLHRPKQSKHEQRCLQGFDDCLTRTCRSALVTTSTATHAHNGGEERLPASKWEWTLLTDGLRERRREENLTRGRRSIDELEHVDCTKSREWDEGRGRGRRDLQQDPTAEPHSQNSGKDRATRTSYPSASRPTRPCSALPKGACRRRTEEKVVFTCTRKAADRSLGQPGATGCFSLQPCRNRSCRSGVPQG